MEQTRQTREVQSRDTEQRVKEWQPAALLPEVKKEPGWSYRWIRSSMAGQADSNNVHKRMREGWEPVKLSDHPELQMFVDSNSRVPDSIEVGGLILCRTPEEFVEQRNGYYGKQTASQTQAVDNSFMKENDARMPLFAEKKSEVRKFGKG